jgi:hypothetical protein
MDARERGSAPGQASAAVGLYAKYFFDGEF